MSQKRLRGLSLLLSVAMITSIISGCGKNEKNNVSLDEATKKRIENLNTKSQFPIVKEPIKLKFMVSKSSTQPVYGDCLVWTEYEKMTNIDIEWEEVLSSAITERRNLILASDQDLPDAFYRCGFSEKEVQKNGSEGTFIRLNDLIDNYMPNFKGVLEKMPSVRKSLPNVNGDIYSIAGVSDSPEVELNPKLYLNKKFMDKVGVQLPKTTDELYTVLKAMRENDANGNGKDDEIPLTAQSWSAIVRALKGAFGLMNKGTRHEHVDLDPKTNTLRFIPTSPEFRQLIEYVNKLYTEKLIDNQIFEMTGGSNTSANIIAKSGLDLVGGFVYTSLAISSDETKKDFVGLEEALEGPNGDKQWNCMRPNTVAKSAFVITKTNPYPEATARWIDYFYSEEGARMYYMGVEGVSYRKTADGKYEYIPEKVEVPQGQTFDAIVSYISPYVGGGNPVLILSDYFNGSEMEPVPYKAAHDLLDYTPDELWDYFIYTNEESEEMATLETDLFTNYYNTIMAEFITGLRPINDQTWAEYCSKMETMGLSRYMELYNTGYNRYKNN